MTHTSAPVQKHLTKDVVYHAAMLLIGTKGQTSSLEVKNHLRDIGYWAKQSAISGFLQELQAEHSWKKEDAGGHLEYTFDGTASNAKSTNAALTDEIIELIKETIGYDDDITASNILTVDLGCDHLDLISLGHAIDAKYGIQSMNHDWNSINNVNDVVKLVESLLPVMVNQNTVYNQASNTNWPTTNAATTNVKVRKPRSVINDSLNPSTSARVTINIDPKGAVAVPSDGAAKLLSDIEVKSKYDEKDWYVYNKNGAAVTGTDSAIYDQKYSSDNVRTAYARLKGIKIQDARAKRVKHI
jgi:acyl carrier protein